MKLKISFLLIVSASISFAEVTNKFKYFVNGKYTDVETISISSVRVNLLCKNTACKALKVANGKPFKIQKTEAPFVGNIGANYCWDVGAKNRILLDSKNNQYDFCVFDDGSMIDAWNLYTKHYPPKFVK